MPRPNFKNQPFDKSLLRKANTSDRTSWETPEQIDIFSAYGPKDRSDLQHLSFVAGIPPYLRGPYSAMYAIRPWTIRQYAGFSTAEESNAFYRRNLAQGQKGLSVAFDCFMERTQRRYFE